MATAQRSESRRVSPSTRANWFDSARRKRASPHIFAQVSEPALARLFRNAGDKKAEERSRSIFACAHGDPDETARALMALRRRKRDKLMRLVSAARAWLSPR